MRTLERRGLRLALLGLSLVMLGTGCDDDPPSAPQACTLGVDQNLVPLITVKGFGRLVGSVSAPGQDQMTRCNFELDGEPLLLNLTGTAPISQSASSLSNFVDDVLEWTGHDRVDLMGLSMGGVVVRYYVKYKGGIGKVDTVITLASPNQGTDIASLSNLLSDILTLGFACNAIPPCDELRVGSPLLNALNSGDATPGDIDYYAFYSETDEVIWVQDGFGIRHDNAEIPGATNHSVQDFCPGTNVSHGNVPEHSAYQEMVDDALTRQPIHVPPSEC